MSSLSGSTLGGGGGGGGSFGSELDMLTVVVLPALPPPNLNVNFGIPGAGASYNKDVLVQLHHLCFFH